MYVSIKHIAFIVYLMNCRAVQFVVVIPPGMTAPLLDQNNRIFN
jgi:hypothetical protein